jgi:two-component system, OmpR family, alkaline phosphatase synthesis response regulator PhoP
MSKNLNDISVLVVEDERNLNEAYTTILKKSTVKVDNCFDGEEALKKVTTFKPDIILLDLRMPRMDGLEFLKKLSLKKDGPKSKVILLSNFDEQKDIDKAFALGAQKYMLKAWVSPKQLLKVIKETA